MTGMTIAIGIVMMLWAFMVAVRVVPASSHGGSKFKAPRLPAQKVKQFLAELVAEHHSAHYNTSDYSNATALKGLAEGFYAERGFGDLWYYC